MKNNLIIKKKKYEVILTVALGAYNLIAYTNNKMGNNKELIIHLGKHKLGDEKIKSLNKTETEIIKGILKKFNKNKLDGEINE